MQKVKQSSIFVSVLFLFISGFSQKSLVIKKDTFLISNIIVDTAYYKNNGLFLIPDSLPDGKWVIYYNNGKLFAKFIIKFRMLNGHAVYYWWNGRLFIDTYYHNNKIDGERRLYNNSGTKIFEGCWEDGLRKGKHKYYRDNGKLYRIEDYYDDVLMKTLNK